MSLFILDTAGDKNLLQNQNVKTNKNAFSKSLPLLDTKVKQKLNDALTTNSYEQPSEYNEEDEYFGLPPPSVDLKEIIYECFDKFPATQHKSTAEEELKYSRAAIKTLTKTDKKKYVRPPKVNFGKIDHSDFNPLTKTYDNDDKLIKIDVEKELINSKLTPDLEQFKSLPMHRTATQRKLNRLEREKTKGPGWFGMPAQEITEEVANDLKILKMRSVLDPKHFYKKNDMKETPKYFQIGTVMHSPLDHYNEKNSRHKKKSLVDELLNDEQFQQFTKRKYKQIMSRRDYYSRKKALKKLKKLKQ